MPLFRVDFLPEVSGNEPLELNLGIQSDAISVVTCTILIQRQVELEEFSGVKLHHFVALDDVPNSLGTFIVMPSPVSIPRQVELGDVDNVRINYIVALEDIPDCKVRDGDVVWRDWTAHASWGLSARELQLMMETYRPLWVPGPGWLDLRQEKWNDVDVRG
jgi:hypothetical protein